MPIAGAASTGTFKNYTIHVSPGAVLESNSPTQVAVNLNNEATSNTSFGSVEFTLNNPGGSIPVVGETVQNAGWSAQNLGSGVVLLTSKKTAAIQPGATLSIVLTITPSAPGTITVGTEVKQSNDFSGTGNDFNLDTANSGSRTVEVVTTVTIAFDQQPTDVQQSNPAKSTFSYMCPPVSVIATAPDGTPVGGVPVTVANNGPGDPGLSFSPASLSSGTVSGGNGVATFGADCNSGIAAANLGSGYTLVAHATIPSGSVASAPSSPFAVVQLLFTCTTNPCQSPKITGQDGTSGSVNTTFGTPGYKILGQFGGSSLVCDSSVSTVAPDELDMKTTVGASGIVTMTFPKVVVNNLANNGTPLMQVCAGASEQFPGSADQGAGVVPEWQGLVANCGANYQTIAFNVCVLSRSKQAANETIQVFVQNLSDPSLW